jgi:RNA polymerase sigma-54 factor
MVLAPQLRQSLEMLQAPVQELRSMIRTELDRNPTLEESPEETAPIGTSPDAGELEDRKRLDFRQEFEILTRLDDEWRDYFFQEREAMPYTAEQQERRDYLFESATQEQSLQEHLLHQLGFAGLNDADRQLGELIIGSVNEEGYLTTPIGELAATCGADPTHMQDLLAVIQDFDPPGVGAVDLRECLLLQLDRLDKAESLAASIVREHLEKLGAHKYHDIAKALKISVDEVQAAARFIATLDPKPGHAYSAEVSPYITPEVVVKKIEGKYLVILNDDNLPRLRISRYYRELMQNEDSTKEVRDYIQERVRASQFLIRSIHQRQQTIYRIATEIVNVQTEFLEKGVAHLKPLTMAEVARAVGLHETTVSRAVAGKHMQTPVGVFEMKYFFTPGLRTADGSVVSNKAVKDAIANILAAEDPTKPLSDQDILEVLSQRGFQVARRTVAKYRIAMRIPSSHLRKVY